MSIAKALPLQIHPNKDLAAKLHRENPQDFTDPNHKPEIAVALSKFEVFAGLRPLSEVETLFQLVPLRQFVPDHTGKWTDSTLREVTRTILKADESVIRRAQGQLSQVPRSSLGNAAYILDLVPRLCDQNGPADPGSLVALTCMNFFVFGPGDAIYIPADGIHAYLSGDIVECMARSNNVLNTGFCPAADRDSADLFVDTLSFRGQGRDDIYLPSGRSERSTSGRTVAYSPPISEFDVLKTTLVGRDSDEITPGDGPGVFIVTSGRGKMHTDGKDFELSQGFIFYVAPGVSVKWETDTGMEIHMACV